MSDIKNALYAAVISVPIFLSGCAFTTLGRSMTNALFERKEETRQIMEEAFTEVLFGQKRSSPRDKKAARKIEEYKKYLHPELSRLRKDGDFALAQGDAYTALTAYTYCRDILGIEAVAQVRRDKGDLEQYLNIKSSCSESGFEVNDARGYGTAVKRGYIFIKPVNFYFPTDKKEYEKDYFNSPFFVADQNPKTAKQTIETFETMLTDLSSKKLIVFEDAAIMNSSKRNIERIIIEIGKKDSLFLTDLFYSNNSINEYNNGKIDERELFKQQGFSDNWLDYLKNIGYSSLFSALKNKGIKIIGARTDFVNEPYSSDVSLVEEISNQLKNGKTVYVSAQSPRMCLQHLPFLMEQQGIAHTIVSQSISEEEKYNELKKKLNDNTVLRVGEDWYILNNADRLDLDKYNEVKKSGERIAHN